MKYLSDYEVLYKKLLTNKKEQYADYNLDSFISELQEFFKISDRQPLKGGKREIFFLNPV